MTTRANITTGAAGGRFVVDPLASEDIFTREDLTEEQRLFGQTAAEFIQKEVLPVVKQLYAHDWAITARQPESASMKSTSAGVNRAFAGTTTAPRRKIP